MRNLMFVVFNLFIYSFLGTFDSSAQVPEPEAGKGLVVFYRTKSFSGGGIKFSVKESDTNYGQLKNGTVIYAQVEPGDRTFFSQVISSDTITLHVEEGMIYYVKGKVKTGALAGRPKFSQVDEKKALKEMKLK